MLPRTPNHPLVHNVRSMQPGIHDPCPAAPVSRLDAIARARRALLSSGGGDSGAQVAPWIARSWRRCLDMGHAPRSAVAFDLLTAQAMRRTRDANLTLTRVAQPVLQQLGQALAQTRYFAILTNAEGVVVDVNGPIDRSDRRADLITRVGVDLSERCVGTTAIGAVLTELQPVWLHRGEHFFDDTSVYSCAGAPLFGSTGQCVGMLDLTGVDVPERPELRHLAMQSARAIENALAMQRPHRVMLRLNWPGHPLGGNTDALIGLDEDGLVTAFNSAARDMVPRLLGHLGDDRPLPHAGELFALPFDLLIDAAGRNVNTIDVPLWSGLHLHALALPSDYGGNDDVAATSLPRPDVAAAAGQRRLRDIEIALIRKAVDEARGNVAQAAARLGVSRATVYRKLGLRKA